MSGSRANRAAMIMSAALVSAGLVAAALIVSGNDNTTGNTSATTAPPTTTALPATTAPPNTTMTPEERQRKIEELDDCLAALDAVTAANAEAPRRMDHALAMADIAASGVTNTGDPVSNTRSAISVAEALHGGIAEALAPQIAAHETFIERCAGVASPDVFDSVESRLSSLHAEAARNRRNCMDRAEHSERIKTDLATDEFARADNHERQYPDNPDLAEQTRAFARAWQLTAAMWRAWMQECP